MDSAQTPMQQLYSGSATPAEAIRLALQNRLKEQKEMQRYGLLGLPKGQRRHPTIINPEIIPGYIAG